MARRKDGKMLTWKYGKMGRYKDTKIERNKKWKDFSIQKDEKMERWRMENVKWEDRQKE